MDEGRKRALLIAASIIAAQRLSQLDFKPCPAYEVVLANAITAAEKLLSRIDSRWPKRENGRDF